MMPEVFYVLDWDISARRNDTDTRPVFTQDDPSSEDYIQYIRQDIADSMAVSNAMRFHKIVCHIAPPEEIDAKLRICQSYPYWEIQAKDCKITIEKISPSASDRGNYIVKVFVHEDKKFDLWIDGADMWPHYYFDWGAMLLEIHEWLKRRKQVHYDLSAMKGELYEWVKQAEQSKND